jgi:hypothetical protein
MSHYKIFQNIEKDEKNFYIHFRREMLCGYKNKMETEETNRPK